MVCSHHLLPPSAGFRGIFCLFFCTPPSLVFWFPSSGRGLTLITQTAICWFSKHLSFFLGVHLSFSRPFCLRGSAAVTELSGPNYYHVLIVFIEQAEITLVKSRIPIFILQLPFTGFCQSCLPELACSMASLKGFR